MHVVLDSGSLAQVTVSGEYPNIDALKSGDGQVTVALADCSDQKIDLTGKIRRNNAALRVNVWATDMPSAVESGKTLQRKIVEEVNRVIRQNRTAPNQTTYNYVNKTSEGEGSKAFSGSAEAAPAAEWTALSDSDYAKLWYSDDSRCQISRSESGESAVLLLGFKVESRSSTIAGAMFRFEGYGFAPNGVGVTLKAWNNAAHRWQGAASGTAGESDETLTLALTEELVDFVDADGYLWFLATTSTSDSETAAVLFCDYAACTVTVRGITYCDIAGYRNQDRSDQKPPIYRTEFSVKSWFIENIGV
jgi:hypothetical protein